MLLGQVDLRRIGMKQAGVDQKLYAGAPGRVDDVSVVLDALADLAGGDEKQLVDAGNP